MSDMTAKQALDIVARLEKRLTRRAKTAAKQRDYYRGKQPLAYASQEWRDFHGKRYEDFADNWCGVVASSPSERWRLTGFRLDETKAKRSPIERKLADDWDRNELDTLSSQGILETVITGQSYTIVWGDEDDNPLVTWETGSDVITEKDAFGRARYALKVWREDDLQMATLYTADELWKFQRAAGLQVGNDGRSKSGLVLPDSYTSSAGLGGWRQREKTGDDTWPLENPFGELPVVEWPNRPMLGADPLSDIAGTMAMQDAANVFWAYLFGAADFAGMPARVIMGHDSPKMPVLDGNGQKIGERPITPQELTRGRMLWLENKGDSQARIDSWDGANLEVFTGVINIIVRHIAAQTRTPVHYIVGEMSNVNGETLLAGETGLVKKVEELHLCSTPPARRLHRLMALARGNKGAADKCLTGTPQWMDAETKTTSQLADAAVKDKQNGFPLAWIAKYRYGLDDQQVEELMEMRRNEQLDDDAVLNRVLRGTQDDADPADAAVA